MRECILAVMATVLGIMPVAAQTNPVKMATAARFDLFGTGTGLLTNGYLLAGDGSAGRQTWLAAGDQPRSYTVSFTVAHFGWMRAGFRFTAVSNGTVLLTLRGPWEQSGAGRFTSGRCCGTRARGRTRH
jgi:hypothetical protein